MNAIQTKTRRIAQAAGLGALALASQVHAAVPADVTTALTDMKADALTVAGLVLVAPRRGVPVLGVLAVVQRHPRHQFGVVGPGLAGFRVGPDVLHDRPVAGHDHARRDAVGELEIRAHDQRDDTKSFLGHDGGLGG